MATDALDTSARDLLAGIYKAVREQTCGGGADVYVALDEALQYLRGRTPPAESYLAVLADAGSIGISREGGHIALTHAGKCYLDGVCASCGYDLRATPQRCPECGTRATAG